MTLNYSNPEIYLTWAHAPGVGFQLIHHGFANKNRGTFIWEDGVCDFTSSPSQAPTMTPTMTPTSSPTCDSYNLRLEIFFDEWPEDIAWYVVNRDTDIIQFGEEYGTFRSKTKQNAFLSSPKRAFSAQKRETKRCLCQKYSKFSPKAFVLLQKGTCPYEPGDIDPVTSISIDMCVDPSECNRLIMLDSPYSDGLCCEYGYGYFEWYFEGSLIASVINGTDRNGNPFGDSLEYNIGSCSPTKSPTNFPTPSPFDINGTPCLKIKIQADRYTEDISWEFKQRMEPAGLVLDSRTTSEMTSSSPFPSFFAIGEHVGAIHVDKKRGFWQQA